MELTFLGLTPQQWANAGISVLIVLGTAILGRWVIKLVLDRAIRRLVGYTRTTIDDAILNTIRTPIYLVLLVLALEAAIARLDFIPDSWTTQLDDIFFVFYLLISFSFAWQFISNFFQWYGQEMAARTETKLDDQLMPFFRRVALIILSAIGLITLFAHFGVDVSALVTTLGIGSLAIALAAQAALADTISGFIIMIDRPFRIGDRIEVTDLDTWGDVVDIGFRSSRIRTRDNRMVIIPNSVISKSLVVNHSYPDSQYRIQIEVGVGYNSDLELVRQTLVSAVEKVEGVLQNQPVEALFLQFGDSALIFRVRWWIDSYVDTRRMFDKVNTAIFNALNEAGVEIPFPQRVVWHQFKHQDLDRLSGKADLPAEN